MLYTAAVLFVIFLAGLLVRVVDLIYLLLIGVLLATAINPAARMVQRRGLSRGASVMVIYLFLFFIIGGLIGFVLPPLVAQASGFATDLPRAADELQRRYADSDQAWIREISASAAQRLRDFWNNPPDFANVRTQAVTVASSVFGSLLSIVTVLLISFYWLAERNPLRRSLLALVPEHNRARIDVVWDHIELKIGAWIRAQLILCGIIGAACALGFGAIGLKYWPALALFAGVSEIIPILGPWIGGVPAILVALIDSPVKAIIVLVFIVVVQQIESNVLVPRIQGDAIGLSPLTVILAILAGTSIAGPIGGILAVPMAASIQVLVQDLIIARGTAEGDIGDVLAANDVVQAKQGGVRSLDPSAHPSPRSFDRARRLLNHQSASKPERDQPSSDD